MLHYNVKSYVNLYRWLWKNEINYLPFSIQQWHAKTMDKVIFEKSWSSSEFANTFHRSNSLIIPFQLFGSFPPEAFFPNFKHYLLLGKVSDKFSDWATYFQLLIIRIHIIINLSLHERRFRSSLFIAQHSLAWREILWT